MSNSAFEPWPLNEQTAKVLGLPLAAVTPTAQLIANNKEWLWFDPAQDMAIWQGPDAQHSFPAHSLAEAWSAFGVMWWVVMKVRFMAGGVDPIAMTVRSVAAT